tara:strand:+ start:288 stop:716 length:429 start_codon:yes stop_codon:yes gene_type:complete
MRKPRKKRPVEKGLPKGYDSKWEYELHQEELKNWEHHNGIIEYTIEHKYHPDFIKIINDKVIYLEAKGRFWDYPEYSKYIWIRKALPKECELVFLFSDPYAPMPAAKKRKDGTKRSHAEWAEKNKFRWFSRDNLPDSWKEEN